MSAIPSFQRVKSSAKRRSSSSQVFQTYQQDSSLNSFKTTSAFPVFSNQPPAYSSTGTSELFSWWPSLSVNVVGASNNVDAAPPSWDMPISTGVSASRLYGVDYWDSSVLYQSSLPPASLSSTIPQCHEPIVTSECSQALTFGTLGPFISADHIAFAQTNPIISTSQDLLQTVVTTASETTVLGNQTWCVETPSIGQTNTELVPFPLYDQYTSSLLEQPVTTTGQKSTNFPDSSRSGKLEPRKQPAIQAHSIQEPMKIVKRKVNHDKTKTHAWVELVMGPKVQKPRTAKQLMWRKQNRKLRACEEHREQKKGCDLSWYPYVRCSTAKTPDFRIDLETIWFFRKKPTVNHALETRRREILKLEEFQDLIEYPQKIRLSQGVSSGDLQHELEIFIAKCKPKDGDKTKHQWYLDGQKRDLEMPPYCVYHLEATCYAVGKYISSSYLDYMTYIMKNSHPLTQKMLSQALEYSERNQSLMIRSALQILAVDRMIELDWHIVNPEVIGLEPVKEEGCPWNGVVPVTPMMDTVLDQVVIQNYLQQLRKSIISGIRSLWEMKETQNCFELLLTVFILATNTQLLLKHSRANAERYQSPHRYNSLDLGKEYFNSHNILLAYYHALIRSDSRRSRVNRYSGLRVPNCSSFSEDEVAFLEQVQGIITSQEPYLLSLRDSNMYETELYWSHQVFSPQWIPIPLEIVEVHQVSSCSVVHSARMI